LTSPIGQWIAGNNIMDWAQKAGTQMITADEFLAACCMHRIDFYTGVPCSFLTALINQTVGEPSLDYVGAASEGEAIAIAAGAWLAGRNTVVMCQNSRWVTRSTR
jgi:sulfopyruvate decarboxylase TPP-binding subunit